MFMNHHLKRNGGKRYEKIDTVEENHIFHTIFHTERKPKKVKADKFTVPKKIAPTKFRM